MKLYPKMDSRIVDLLRLSGDPRDEYAAMVIEFLREKVTNLEKDEKNLIEAIVREHADLNAQLNASEDLDDARAIVRAFVASWKAALKN